MADSKLSALTALTGANVDTANDLLYIDDVSVTQSKKILVDELRIALLSHTALTNSLGGDVNLNNTANYFQGPIVAQGTSGLWWFSGQVVCYDSNGSATFYAKLWDGTQVVASAVVTSSAANAVVTIPLSGFSPVAPVASYRISVRDITSTGGVIGFSVTGNGLDSTLSAVRIG